MKFWFMMLCALIISSLISCEDSEKELVNEITEKSLVGRWDAYLKISQDGKTTKYPNDILWNKEHGFELSNDDTYHPRYINADSSTYLTDYKISRSWFLLDGKGLVFGEENDVGIYYEIIRLDSTELWMGTKSQYRLRRKK